MNEVERTKTFSGVKVWNAFMKYPDKPENWT